jgi:RHS repeat-associated protein
MSQKRGGGQWTLISSSTFSDIQYVEVSAVNGTVVADGMQFSEPDPCECFGFCPPCPPQQSGKTTFFIHTDHLGTPRAVSDDTQFVVWRWDSTPFGEGAPDEDPDGDSNDFVLNLRFPGQYYDAESGLIYNYFRYYDASTGRYLEGDPIGLHGGLNPYSYTLNSPLVSSDPLGLYKSARWLSGPSLGGISREKIGEMGFGEYWTLIPPAIGFGGTWWMIKAQISGVVECIDEEECGEHRRDVFNVNVDLGKRVGIGYGITTYPWFQAGRKAAEALSSINHAIEVYRNEWTQMAIDMARNPMTSCFIMSVAGPGK